jgi:Cell wall-associated hydrolases (invasion-associated proteins)
MHNKFRPTARAAGAAALSLALLLGSSSLSVVRAQSLSSLKQQYAQLQKQQQQLQNTLYDLKHKVIKESQKKSQLDASMTVIKKQITVMNAQISAAKDDVRKKNLDIVLTQKRIDKNTEQYKDRVRTMYETGGNTSELSLLLSSKNVTDFFTRYNTLKVISEHDNELINSLKSDKVEMNAEKLSLQKDLKGLEDAQGTLAAKKQLLNAQLSQQAAIVDKLRQNKNATEQQADEVNQKARETDAEINAEIAREAAIRKAQLEKAAAAAAAQGSPSAPVSDNYLVSYALGFQGVPYVFGSADPQYGFDCSGFVQYVYANAAGIALPHSAAAQSGYGSPVSSSNLQPGDLVFFATDGGSWISHVGIYIGGDQMVEANSSGSGYQVMVTGLFSNGYWSSRFVCARRLLN